MARTIKTEKITKTTRTVKSPIARAKVRTTKKVEPAVEQPEQHTPPVISKNPAKAKFLIPAIGIILAVALLYAVRGWFIVAMVNGQPITRMTFTHDLEQKDGKQVLSSDVSKTLIYQEASKRHVSVSQAEVTTAMKQVEDSLTQQGQTLDQALAQRGMSRQDFEEQIKIQKLVEKMLGNDIKVSDQEVQDYTAANKDSLPQGLSDAQTQAQVRQQLEQQKLSTKFQTWLSDLQKKANINYFVSF